jgi:two-component system NtrC family response regulator
MTPSPLFDIERLLIGDSAPMHRVRALIRKVAPSSIPVLIEGATGSGKELVARALHVMSGRPGQFVAFNVCAVAESMFEDALFGHVRGAFTGAVNDRAGYLLEANGGTVFLDEISGLSPALQAKLLRAIETREFRPIGSRADSHSNFRLISATNVRLADVAAHGGFRNDLLYRLRGIVIELPPLSSRQEDIPQLAQHFASGARLSSSHVRPRAIAADAMDLLCSHTWPGNVRELKAAVECAGALAEGNTILRADLFRAGLFGESTRRPLHDRREGFATRRLLEVLDETAWDIAKTAAILGVHRATVYRRLGRAGCDPQGGLTEPSGVYSFDAVTSDVHRPREQAD